MQAEAPKQVLVGELGMASEWMHCAELRRHTQGDIQGTQANRSGVIIINRRYGGNGSDPYDLCGISFTFFVVYRI